MKYTLLIIAILTVEIFSQVTSPSGYTTNYGFRKWAQGANPSADSLNANWDELDTYIKTAYDSAQAKGSKLGNNTWTGTNTFSGTVALNGVNTSHSISPTSDDAYSLGTRSKRWEDIWANQMHAEKFLVYNPEKNDSVYITLDDSVVTFDKPISFTAGELMPSSIGKLGNDTSSFAIVYTDTIISGESYLSLQGKQGGVEFADVWGISAPNSKSINAATTTIDCTGLSYIETVESEACSLVATLTAGATRREGSILVVVNASNYNVTLKNGTGNMILGSDTVLGQYDNVTLLYYDIGGGSYRWLKIGYINN